MTEAWDPGAGVCLRGLGEAGRGLAGYQAAWEWL